MAHQGCRTSLTNSASYFADEFSVSWSAADHPGRRRFSLGALAKDREIKLVEYKNPPDDPFMAVSKWDG